MSDKSRRQSRKEILPLQSSTGKVVVKENPIYTYYGEAGGASRS